MSAATNGLRPGPGWAEEIAVGTKLPSVVLPLTYEVVATQIEGTGDHFPGHHDPEYARAQGNESIYLNTMFVAGFFDRVVTDRAGSATFVRSRRFRMMRSACAGETLTGHGEVTGNGVDVGGYRVVDVHVLLETEKGPYCAGAVSFTLDPWWQPSAAPEEPS
jgi:acyl dehydratase